MRLDGGAFGQLFHLWIVLMLVDNGLDEPAEVGGPAATLCLPGHRAVQMWNHSQRISQSQNITFQCDKGKGVGVVLVWTTYTQKYVGLCDLLLDVQNMGCGGRTWAAVQ